MNEPLVDLQNHLQHVTELEAENERLREELGDATQRAIASGVRARLAEAENKRLKVQLKYYAH